MINLNGLETHHSLLNDPASGSPGTEKRTEADTHIGLCVGDAEAGEIQYGRFLVGVYSWSDLAEKKGTRRLAGTGNL
ncbi:MAG: hypothetical protein OEY86_10745 [Nitrospira sp.]|nr:hypothetical protein [Nitrospira sp.]